MQLFNRYHNFKLIEELSPALISPFSNGHPGGPNFGRWAFRRTLPMGKEGPFLEPALERTLPVHTRCSVTCVTHLQMSR